MNDFPTAKELAKTTTENRERIYEENHARLLKTVRQGILKAAEEGENSYSIKSNGYECLRTIYEPLGYKVSQEYDYYGDPSITISW